MSPATIGHSHTATRVKSETITIASARPLHLSSTVTVPPSTTRPDAARKTGSSTHKPRLTSTSPVSRSIDSKSENDASMPSGKSSSSSVLASASLNLNALVVNDEVSSASQLSSTEQLDSNIRPSVEEENSRIGLSEMEPSVNNLFNHFITTTQQPDLCALVADLCGANSVCSNTESGPRCGCKEGFYKVRVDGRPACHPVTTAIKCTRDQDCDRSNTTCIQGSCQCRTGFEARGPLCVDIDECSAQPSVCGHYADCVNTLGGWECPCWAGYERYPNSNRCVQANNCKKDCGDLSYCVFIQSKKMFTCVNIWD